MKKKFPHITKAERIYGVVSSPDVSESSVDRLVSLGDTYADVCHCGKRAEWGVAKQKGPAGCREAVQTGRVYCDKHRPKTKG